MRRGDWRKELRADFAVVNAVSQLHRRVAVDIKTVAALLVVDRRVVAKAVELGQLKSIQVGSTTLIPTGQLRRKLGILEDDEFDEDDLPDEVKNQMDSPEFEAEVAERISMAEGFLRSKPY